MTGRAGMTCIHVWDKHGKLEHEDAVPGLGDLYGLGLDQRNGVYFMTAATRVIDGKPYLNRWAGTVAKFQIGKGRVLSVGKGVPLALSPENQPQRPFDLVSAEQGGGWAENPEWLYGGVGFGGKNTDGCACCNCRFTFDYFNRSFAPELERYGVAVLDANGNLILRLGQYGNVDDGLPLVPAAGDGRAALAGPAKPRSVGGDEVALFHGAYLATDTDHRLFIADPGNGRILSVKLDYAATETLPVK
jgi:hypothetical protein